MRTQPVGKNASRRRGGRDCVSQYACTYYLIQCPTHLSVCRYELRSLVRPGIWSDENLGSLWMALWWVRFFKEGGEAGLVVGHVKGGGGEAGVHASGSGMSRSMKVRGDCGGQGRARRRQQRVWDGKSELCSQALPQTCCLRLPGSRCGTHAYTDSHLS